jgi:hypothetical protein
MRKDFEECVNNGGRVRVKQLKNGKSIRLCYDKSGNSFSGGIIIEKQVNANNDEKNKKQADMNYRLVDSLLELKNHINTNYHV